MNKNPELLFRLACNRSISDVFRRKLKDSLSFVAIELALAAWKFADITTAIQMVHKAHRLGLATEYVPQT